METTFLACFFPTTGADEVGLTACCDHFAFLPFLYAILFVFFRSISEAPT